MNDYEKIYSFENLYKAHLKARKGKRDTKEVIDFELNLSYNLLKLSRELKDKSYRISGYYSFKVYDPKERDIHALHYRDRVVQHCLCDEVLSKILDKRLIYDTAACRIGKGTHFALNRVTQFLVDYNKHYGNRGYILKCDIRKYFNHIDHVILKDKLRKVIENKDVYELLCHIIDSFSIIEGKGLPLGNQTSQWFAIYYLDGLDRLVKEKLRIPYYSRYMDDCILICHSKEYLKECLDAMRIYIEKKLLLEFNNKTQIFPIKNGVEYLGFHFYLSSTGKVIKRVKKQTKLKYKRRLKDLKYQYSLGLVSVYDVFEVLDSYDAHLSYGHDYYLRKKSLSRFVLKRIS